MSLDTALAILKKLKAGLQVASQAVALALLVIGLFA